MGSQLGKEDLDLGNISESLEEFKHGRNVSAFPYYGGKYSHLSWLKDKVGAKNPGGVLVKVFVEPFGGAGAVMLNTHLDIKRVYNDMDENLVNFFQVLASSQGDKLIECLSKVPYSEDVYKGAIHFRDGKSGSKFERAMALYIIARQCRDGMTAKAGLNSWSKPGKSGSKERVWKNSFDRLKEVKRRLRYVELRCQNAISLIQEFDSKITAKKTLYYLDPPYPFDSRETGPIYGFEATDDLWSDLEALCRKVRGKVIISTYLSILIEGLFIDYWRDRVPVGRFLPNGKDRWFIRPFVEARKSGLLRKKKQEILISNYNIFKDSAKEFQSVLRKDGIKNMSVRSRAKFIKGGRA